MLRSPKLSAIEVVAPEEEEEKKHSRSEIG
jgi:hypothetical protein